MKQKSKFHPRRNIEGEDEAFHGEITHLVLF